MFACLNIIALTIKPRIDAKGMLMGLRGGGGGGGGGIIASEKTCF